MEQGPTEKAIFERSIRHKMPLPEAIKNAPSLFMGLEFYYNAFRHLSSCRSSGMGVGNIDYFMCCKYCDQHEIFGDDREDFVTIIMAMDETFVEYCNKKSKTKDKKKLPEEKVDDE